MKVLLVSVGIFMLAFARGLNGTVVGSEIVGCDSSLVVYCWTADVLGGFLAWTLWHAAFSLAFGWAIVVLPRSYREA